MLILNMAMKKLNFFQKRFEKFDCLSADQHSRAVETVNEVVIVNCHSRLYF